MPSLVHGHHCLAALKELGARPGQSGWSSENIMVFLPGSEGVSARPGQSDWTSEGVFDNAAQR